MLNSIINGSKALENALAGEELSFNDGMELMNYDNIFMLGKIADRIKKQIKGNTVTFTASYYLNYTNVCAASCPLCAFYKKNNEPDAYTLTKEQILNRVSIAVQKGANEMHIVGGFHPNLELEYYEGMIRSIKEKFPNISIKSFTPAEIFFIARVTHNTTKEVLLRLQECGLNALAGGGAEIFHPEPRKQIVVGKCSGDEWLQVAELAHTLGIMTNCTMLYGHVEKPEHVIDHIMKLRELQKKTGGFLTFIPLKFSPENTELKRNGLVKTHSSALYDLRIIAISRLMLANVINNISAYYIALGKKMAQVALTYGASDLVGTAFAEEIFRATGLTYSSTIEELVNMIKEINHIPAQRDTFHNIIKRFS
ncbi:MAG: aminofutalosine synthase MqnE [Thaumarchaeota archaeon]|nr:aminofutalosine synthase MqnE [Nitrososphaerota archaeon]|tara:strand:- start:2878 stop:3978 length:1101 start_codon:yes stop_codon:yes gene_type:complete